MIGVRQPDVGKHMLVKPAVRKTHEAGGEEKREKDISHEQNKK